MAHLEAEESPSDKELNESNASTGAENSQDSQEESESVPRSDEEQKEKLVKLPLGRIKTIIKTDPEELFIDSLAKEAYKYTAQMKKKTVQKRDVENAIDNVDALIFLEGMLD